MMIQMDKMIPFQLILIPRVSGVNRVHHNLTTFYNPNPALHGDIDDIEDANFAMMTFMNEQHYALASLGSIEYNPAPTTFRDAMSRKDKLQWIASMHVEFANMHDKDVWRIVIKMYGVLLNIQLFHLARKLLVTDGFMLLKMMVHIVLVQSDRVLVKFLVRIFRRIMPL
jgi:hypothetical protein